MSNESERAAFNEAMSNECPEFQRPTYSADDVYLNVRSVARSMWLAGIAYARAASANETGAEGATWYDRWQAECTRDHGEYDENAPIADRLRWWVPKSARHGTILLEDDLREAADDLSRSPAMAVEAVAIPNSPAYCLRGLYKPADEYFIDGKPCTPDEYIAWQAGIIEAVTKAKLPDPKYYGGSAEEGDQHDVKCAYVDGWNDCRASILAAPQPAQADARVGLTDEQRETILDVIKISTDRRAVVALRALLESHTK